MSNASEARDERLVQSYIEIDARAKSDRAKESELSLILFSIAIEAATAANDSDVADPGSKLAHLGVCRSALKALGYTR